MPQDTKNTITITIQSGGREVMALVASPGNRKPKTVLPLGSKAL